ncbi:MAG: ribonuclease T [Halieaceae bacterium]
MTDSDKPEIKDRFRGFLPVIVDLETGGFRAATDALLEIAATFVRVDDQGLLSPGETITFNVEPFEGANLEPSALEFTGIDPENPLRNAVPEEIALGELYAQVRKEVKSTGCNRAILVGHNAHFDAGFLNAANDRCEIKRNPFHPFSHFDTATAAGIAFGHTVLAQACKRAGLDFNNSEAHSAAYDAFKTAELFCLIVNRWQQLGGWQWTVSAEGHE